MRTLTKAKTVDRFDELDVMLPLKDVAAVFRVDKQTITRWCKEGRFPQPLKLGRSYRWKVADVRRVIEKQS